jgi:fructokinase
VGEVVGLGEVLWDLLPAGPQLGGAPFNFTFHCHQLGQPAVMVSRVGRDELGGRIRSALREHGLSEEFVQEDAEHPTGTVSVQLDEQGLPSYTIHTGVAWDHLAWDPRLDGLLARARAVCFGSLIQRSDVARATVQRAVRQARNALVVFDINLRQNFYSRSVLEESLHACRWAKLNEDELVVLRDLLGLEGGSDRELLSCLRQRYAVELVALTRGARGCLVQTTDEEVAAPGLPVQVVDTVGAGDAFTAGLLVGVLEGQPVGAAVGLANRLAARVAASAGGTPRFDPAELERIRQ